MSAENAYASNRAWANHFRGLYAALRPQVTAAIDIKDMLRASLVFSVSAFDALIHDIVVDEFREIFDGRRLATDSYRQLRKNAAERFGVARAHLTRDQMLSHIRERNELISFQSVASVAAAMRSIGIQNIWDSLAIKQRKTKIYIQNQFEVIVQRRHLIVHQADVIPVLGSGPIDVSVAI